MSLGNQTVFELRDNSYLKPWRHCSSYGYHDPTPEHPVRRSASEPNLQQPEFKQWMQVWSSPDRNRPRFIHQADPMEEPPYWGSPFRGEPYSPQPWATDKLPGGNSERAGSDFATRSPKLPTPENAGPLHPGGSPSKKKDTRGLLPAIESSFPPVYPMVSNWKRSTYLPTRSPGYVGTMYTR